jgi:hypothetical protein
MLDSDQDPGVWVRIWIEFPIRILSLKTWQYSNIDLLSIDTCFQYIELHKFCYEILKVGSGTGPGRLEKLDPDPN